MAIDVFKDKKFMEENPLVVARLMIWFFNSISHNIYVQVCGVVLIGSMKDLTLWDATTFIGAAKNEHRALALGYLTTCTAARFGGVMMFDQPIIITPVFYIITLFVSAKLRERMHLCGDNYERVQEHLGNDMNKVPTCIGGTLEDSEFSYWILNEIAKTEQETVGSTGSGRGKKPLVGAHGACTNTSCLRNLCICGTGGGEKAGVEKSVQNLGAESNVVLSNYPNCAEDVEAATSEEIATESSTCSSSSACTMDLCT